MRGAGPDVVMIGAAIPMLVTRPAARALAECDYRVIDFDYGESHPEPEPRGALQQVDDVMAVMEAVGVSDCSLVGFSRGAVTAYGVAAMSDEVATLTLAFPVAGFSDSIYLTDPDPVPLPDESQEEFMRRGLERLFSTAFLDRRWDEAVALVTSSAGSVERVPRADETPFPGDLSVEVPVLVIEGGQDQIVNTQHPARYLEHLPASKHVVVPEASHGWIMEDPEGFARVFDEFFGSV